MNTLPSHILLSISVAEEVCLLSPVLLVHQVCVSVHLIYSFPYSRTRVSFVYTKLVNQMINC